MNSEKAGCLWLFGLSLGWLVLGLLVSGTIGIFTIPYIVNTWLVYFGKAAILEWWHGFLLGLVPGVTEVSIPAAVFTFLLMLFLV